MTTRRRSAPLLLLLGALVLGSGTKSLLAAPLTADDLALIVNQNEPAGLELAQFYAHVRHVPDGRILRLDLPKSEAISFRTYDAQVAPLVRAWLNQPALAGHVNCLVTFFGLPLRIDARINTSDEIAEQQMLRQTMTQMPEHFLAAVQRLEALAQTQISSFAPGSGQTLEQLTARANLAMTALRTHLRQLPAGTAQAQAAVQLMAALEPLVGESAHIATLEAQASTAGDPATHPTTERAGHTDATTRPVTPADVRQAQARFQTALAEIAALQAHRDDPAFRQRLRNAVLQHLGLFRYVNLLSTQLDYLNAADTASAFDSELALVEWPPYSRVRWRENPLFYAARTSSPLEASLKTLEVMRLDAPTSEQVHDLILAGLQAEDEGLKGQVVIDSRGMSLTQFKPADRALAEYDHCLADLAALLKKKTHLQVLFDDKPDVLPAGSATDVALYCGWYSLRHYVPACKFNPGAVGFHIASFELISLHNAGETGWVAGLLNDGVAATLGPVAEPYLQSFPRPDDFFPLLLTGKLPLADVYWATTPMTSWMQTMIGDPLYTPYRNDPALQTDDLPPRLSRVLNPPPDGR